MAGSVEITFRGVCDFVVDSEGLQVQMPDCSNPPNGLGLQPHIAYVKVARRELPTPTPNPDPFDPELSDDHYGVVRVSGNTVAFAGVLSTGGCNYDAMKVSAVPNMAKLSGQNAPKPGAPLDGVIMLENGRLAPAHDHPLIHWGFGPKGSGAPTVGVGLSNRFLLQMDLPSVNPSFSIQSKNQPSWRLDFDLAKEPNPFAEIGCLEQPDILPTSGKYTPRDEDIDFLFHYALTNKGIDVKTNQIPLLVLASRRTEGKKTDCFAARWF